MPENQGSSHKEMKVLMVIDSLRLGGAERVLATLSGAAPHAGFRFELAVLSAPGSHRSVMEPVLAEAGVNLSYLSIRRLIDPQALPRLVRAIRSSGCDVVHAHLEDAATLVPLAARLAGRPAVCSFHHVAVEISWREALKERLAVAAANRSAGVIFVSQSSLDSFTRTYSGPRSNWCVIENGVDLNAFSTAPATMPLDLQIPSDALIVTIVGALRGRKGHAVALRAWPAVRERFANARLLIVGDGPEGPRLRSLASELGISDSVIFAGTRNDVALLVRASELVVLPSQHEALPTTLIEAAACGRAVISTDIDGVPEVVTDGETGLLVPVDDHRALAQSLLTLLSDEPRRRAMGQRARLLAEQRFDAQRWAKRLYELYSQASNTRATLPG
jgi:glycosyltransferase involved in cell wall biosynthesis